MNQYNVEESNQTLHDIKKMMERSSRFLSLSGWSGIWAGATAIVGAWVAHIFFHDEVYHYSYTHGDDVVTEPYTKYFSTDFYSLLMLAAIIFVVAFTGAYLFTFRKGKKDKTSIWNPASRAMFRSMAIPLLSGALMSLSFMWYGTAIFIAPACLIFYGLALYNGSKYTLSEIRYLGLSEIILGCINLFLPGYGFHFWTVGFGVLHILYGILMWNKYDKVSVK